jgi:ATP-dependent Clp protease ATP-binding subunit ClpC
MKTTVQRRLPAVEMADLCAVLEGWTGIPAARIHTGRVSPELFARLRQQLEAGIFGQNAAIEATVAALERSHRLPDPAGQRRPLWNVIFAGPSGTGKTSMAQRIGDEFFGNGSVCRIDCSELTESHHTARLVGSPPGYVGYGRPGQLVAALEQRNSGVLLFDEVEKADPQIQTAVLLPLLGDAVVHDMSTGRELDASQWVVIMTSNVGSRSAHDHPVGFAHTDGVEAAPEDAARDAVARHFPREFMGRVDDVIIFGPLDTKSARCIWDREAAAFESSLRARGDPVRLEITAEARKLFLDHLAPAVERQGARAIVRVFKKAIADRCLSLVTEPVVVPSVLLVEAVSEGLRYRLVPEPDGAESGDES